MNERLDTLVVKRGLLESREKAKAYILSGNITVNGETVKKPHTLVQSDADIRLHMRNNGWASRGGLKLEAALQEFNVPVEGAFCLDIGASSGGFTDCLIKKGARYVIALDVGKNQIDYRLRRDPRVRVVEGFNARFIDRLEVNARLDIVTIDVSFISIRLVLDPLKKIIDTDTVVIALIKPQFELEKPYRGFGGVVRQKTRHKEILTTLHEFFTCIGYREEGYTFSKIRGAKGNIEYFVHLKKGAFPSERGTFDWHALISEIVERAHASFST